MKKLIELVLRWSAQVMAKFVRSDHSVIICLQAGKILPNNTKHLLRYAEQNNLPFSIGVRGAAAITDGSLSAFNAFNVVDFHSFSGLLAFVRSKVLVISHGVSDFSPFSTLNHQRVINIWHGIPLKDIGQSDKGKDWDKMVVSSAAEADYMMKAFGLPVGKIAILGMPKADVLFGERRKSKDKLIVYLPTFRDSGLTTLFPFENLDLYRIDKILEEENASIAIKLHSAEQDKIDNRYNDYEHIRFFSSDVDLENEMIKAIALITDYSGVLYDAVALNIPLIFLPYDIEEYKKERGFLYSYEDTPGPKVYDQFEFEQELRNILGGSDSYLAQRRAFLEKYYKYQDQGNSERVVSLINTELEH